MVQIRNGAMDDFMTSLQALIEEYGEEVGIFEMMGGLQFMAQVLGQGLIDGMDEEYEEGEE